MSGLSKTITTVTPELPLLMVRCTKVQLYLDDYATLIIAKSYVVGAPQATHTPNTLHAVVQCAFQTVGAGMPDTYCAFGDKRRNPVSTIRVMGKQSVCMSMQNIRQREREKVKANA